MVRVFRWAAAAASALLLLILALYLSARAIGPTAIEQQARAMVDATPVHQGLDGFAELYAVTHDIPAKERVGVLARDVRRVAALPPPSLHGAGELATRSALDDWPRSGESRPGDPAWCRATPHC